MPGVNSEPRSAIEARRREGADTDWVLYRQISKKPGESIYALAKELKWSSGKVRGSVNRLIRDGFVYTEPVIRDGRCIIQVKPVSWTELLTPEELEEFKNLEF